MRNKFLTKILGATLGLAMAIGVGVGVAANNRVAKGLNADTTHSVILSGGSFQTDHITWTLDDVITVQQLKGTSSTAVNSSYISAPRVYKGHILSFVASDGCMLKSISITYNGTYYGNSMTAGIAVTSNAVTNNTTAVSRTWANTSGGTHVVGSVSDDGLEAIYIQNVATADNVQLRPTAISITYSTGGSTPVVDTVTASIKDGTYYAGSKLIASDFNVTVGWTEGKDDTNPTSDFTWTVNGEPDGDLVLGSNAVVVTYAEVASPEFNVTAVEDVRWNTGFNITKVASIVLPDSGDTADKYYVSARITAITNVTNGHGNAVDEDGTEFAIYFMYNYNGLIKYNNMASDSKPVVGDIVVLYGVFTKFNSAPEIKNAYVVQRNGTISFAPVVSIDLGTSDTTTSASASLLTWEAANKFDMQVAKSGASTATNNYYPGTPNQSYTSTRFYKNSQFTLSPKAGITATKAIFYATSDGYATAFAGSTPTNSTLSSSGSIVTLTFTDGTQPASVKVGGTCGFTSVEIYYSQTIRQAVDFEAPTRSSLYYRYHKSDSEVFTYPNVALRFGTLIEKELWDFLDAESDIQGYGVLVSTDEFLGSDKLEDYYGMADGISVFNYPKTKAEKAVPTLATDAQKGELVGNYYIWNVFYNIPSENLTTVYAATAYIIVDGEVVFLKEIRTSAAKIAYDLIQGGTDAGSAEGSLQNLANQYSA